MNELNRQKVENYLKSDLVLSLAPLKFDGYESPKEEFDLAKFTVDDMVKRTLTLSEQYLSVNSEDNSPETRPTRWRSSLDIWRHIKYYYPDITIFDVLHSLYNLHDKCGGQFCHNIMRRTFRLKEAVFNSNDWSNYQELDTDEYGLFWNDWKEI